MREKEKRWDGTQGNAGKLNGVGDRGELQHLFYYSMEPVNCFLCCTGIRIVLSFSLTKKNSSKERDRKSVTISEAAEKNAVEIVNISHSFNLQCLC